MVTVLAAVIAVAAAFALYWKFSPGKAAAPPARRPSPAERRIAPPTEKPTVILPPPTPTAMSATYELSIRPPTAAPSLTPQVAAKSETSESLEANLTPSAASGDVKAPELVYGPDPIYPEPAPKARIEGMVVIEAALNERGEIENPVVLRSVNPLLDQAALDAARKWRYAPATREGTPIRVFVTINMTFKLKTS